MRIHLKCPILPAPIIYRHPQLVLPSHDNRLNHLHSFCGDSSQVPSHLVGILQQAELHVPAYVKLCVLHCLTMDGDNELMHRLVNKLRLLCILNELQPQGQACKAPHPDRPIRCVLSTYGMLLVVLILLCLLFALKKCGQQDIV